MKYVERILRQRRWLLSTALAGALTACGGGGSDSSGASRKLALTGTAATGGAAIAARPVEARCATGTGSTTSASDGKFALDVTDGALPCALRVTATDGSVLHSVATGSGDSAVANINPATHLVVAALTGADPATLYDNFSSTTASAVTAAGATAAVTSVAATLQPAGIDLTAIGNVLTADLVASNGGTAGNAYGQALDALAAAQASSGTTLSQLAQTVANTTAVVAVAPSGTPSLPADLLLKPAASNCSALRSGRYRIVIAQVATAGNFSTGTFDLNAATLGYVADDGKTGTMVAAGTCRYTLDGGNSQLVVSQAGVIVLRTQESGVMRIGIGFPEQAHTVAELEGTWNSLGMEGNGTAYRANASTVTFNGSGVSTAISYCADVKTCTAVTTTTIARSVNSSGGFDNTYSDGNDGDRFFAYRAGGGEWMLVDIAGGGHFGISTRQRTNALPTVGAATSFWNFDVNSQLQVPSAPSSGGNTITSVNDATGTFTRDNITSGTTTRPESLQANSPRPGYTLRNAATGVINSAGATVNVPEFISLSFRGMGLSAASLTASGVYALSIVQP
jgi:hypothetical protein